MSNQPLPLTTEEAKLHSKNLELQRQIDQLRAENTRLLRERDAMLASLAYLTPKATPEQEAAFLEDKKNAIPGALEALIADMQQELTRHG